MAQRKIRNSDISQYLRRVIPLWETSESYDVGDIVLNGNLIYRCITTHISVSTFDATKFDCLSASVIQDNVISALSTWSSDKIRKEAIKYSLVLG